MGMLHIAFCDDEAVQRAQVGGLLQAYCSGLPGCPAKLSVFSSGEELLRQAEAAGGFDLYVLDVIMPHLSGIDLGLKLRELGCDGPIIYLTTSPDYAVDSYLAQAFYYLLKPVEPARLREVLDQAAAVVEKRRAAALQIKTKGGLRLVPLDQILYVELVGRAACYHLADGSTVAGVTFRGSFQTEVAPLLADPRFTLCASSFAVNLHYVTAVDKRELTVGGKVRVPLSRGLYAPVKKRWSDYWLGGGGPC